MRVLVLGAGAWGTALAITLSAKHAVSLWARDPAQLLNLRRERSNARYLPGFRLPEGIGLPDGLPQGLVQAELAVVAEPTASLGGVLRAIAQARPDLPVIWVCKGFEGGTSAMPHQVVAQELGAAWPAAVLSGPSFAVEVAQGLPTALTLASADGAFAQRMAGLLNSARFRIYSSQDVVGVEIGGAVKNVMAIAAGISDGLGFGHNARAELITRGLAEIARLGAASGARPETFFGLSGIGDLILTCTGDLSRNRTVGLRLGRGERLKDILEDLHHVAEGVSTAQEVCRLASGLGVDMPISDAVYRVLYHGLPPGDAVEQLLAREPKPESRD